MGVQTVTALENSHIIMIGYVCFVLIAIAYWLGKNKGKKEATAQLLLRTDIITPSLDEITIRGFYQVDKQSNKQIVGKLADWMMHNGFRYTSFENFIKLVNVSEPPQAKKKKNYLEKLKEFRSGYPYEVNLFISQSKNDNTLNVEVSSLPFMHRQMAQGVQHVFPKSHVEDAQRLCKDVIKEIMCILNAKVKEEPFVEANRTKKKKITVVTNTLLNNDINKKVHELIGKSTHQILLAGWVDREVIGELEKALERDVNIKIITKSPDGSDKLVRDDFSRLVKKLGKHKIRLNSRFHDRFLVADSESVIGSFYFTSASKTRFESVVYTNNEGVIASLTEHFNLIWNDVTSTKPKS